MSSKKYLLVAVMLVCCFIWPAFAAINDNETAAHDDAAAKYQIEAIYAGADLRIIQFKLGVLSHYSYLLISDGKAMIVDPGRDIDVYLAYAIAEKLDWVGTLLTHSHADFIAGHREMAVSTGAPIYAAQLSSALFPHIELKENDVIKVGKAQVKILETPGHTPDSICALVGPAAEPDKHEFIFSGDTLFVGSLGRPDLMGGTVSAVELAGAMFATWNDKLAKLPDALVVLPAHGAGSLCGANLSDKPSSTIGEEKKTSPYLKLMDNRSAFIARFLSGLEAAPGYFKENARINRNGPEIVDWTRPLGNRLESLTGLIEQKDIYVVDVRDATGYAEKHVPRSVNIALRGRFESWVGTIVPFKSRLILIGSQSEIDEAGKRLKRVGYEAEYVIFAEHVAAGGLTTSSTLVSPAELLQQMGSKTAPVIVDVRRPGELQEMKIGDVVNITLDKLEDLAKTRLSANETVLALCNSAYRSSIAVGLLERCGFNSSALLAGGMEAWLEAGFPVSRTVEKAPLIEPSSQTAANSKLPERITAADLFQLLRKKSDSFEVIDIRSADEFADYTVSGAIQVSAEELLSGAKWQSGDRALIIIDREGLDSFAVAGALASRTSRQVKAVVGGMKAFWRASEMGFIDVKSSNVPPVNDPVKVLPNNPPVSQPVKKIHKGAGC